MILGSSVGSLGSSVRSRVQVVVGDGSVILGKCLNARSPVLVASDEAVCISLSRLCYYPKQLNQVKSEKSESIRSKFLNPLRSVESESSIERLYSNIHGASSPIYSSPSCTTKAWTESHQTRPCKQSSPSFTANGWTDSSQTRPCRHYSPVGPCPCGRCFTFSGTRPFHPCRKMSVFCRSVDPRNSGNGRREFPSKEVSLASSKSNSEAGEDGNKGRYSESATRGYKPMGRSSKYGQNDERSEGRDRYENRNGGRSASYQSKWKQDKEGRGSNVEERRPNWRGGGQADDWRWQSREVTPRPRLEMEGESLYGVAPIISALQASRRKFYSLYMQENLLLNVERGKRKDKAAVTFIEKTVLSLGLTVKTASKHDLNMLVDNRPHQGLVLDASPLEMVPVTKLDPPLYQEGKCPVWVALDEVTDPQNFGAILRSAYFLGAEGVVVCAKNSAPLSGVVSKASAGALEVMEVQFCKNMMKFLDGCRENGWRVLGASVDNSMPVGKVPRGIATILVLGNEGKGLRTNVRRACDQLVSIAGVSNGLSRPNVDLAVDLAEEDSEEMEFSKEDEDEGEDVLIRGAEVGFMSGPVAVDSLNVSVATGIMLYELLGNVAETGPVESVVSV